MLPEAYGLVSCQKLCTFAAVLDNVLDSEEFVGGLIFFFSSATPQLCALDPALRDYAPAQETLQLRARKNG